VRMMVLGVKMKTVHFQPTDLQAIKIRGN